MIKKIIVFLILSFSIINLTGCKNNHKNISTKTVKNNIIPKNSPGFNFPAEINKFKITDYTNTLKNILPNKKIKYSAIWAFKTDYQKQWEKFSQNEKKQFRRLLAVTIFTMAADVKNLGGNFEINKDPKDLNERIGGKLELPYRNTNIKIWNVIFNSGLNDGYGKPFISIYVAHTKFMP